MSRMSLDTAIRLSAEVKGGGAIDRVKRSLQDFGKTGQTSKRDLDQLRAATFQFSRANDQTIAGIRNSINAFRGLQEQARIGGREFKRYGEEIQRLEAKLSGLDGAATKAGASLGQKLAAGLAAAGVGRALQGITQQAANFDAELRKAAAISPTEGAFGTLKRSIEEVAAAAAGTPTEVAALATALSRAGFTADEVSASLAGVVKGAEATSVSFDQMGGITADVLRAFGMQVSQTNEVVDVLTKTSNTSNQTVLDLGESLKFAAPTARSLGVSLTDLAGTLGVLANNGIRGSEAGTALRTGFSRLQLAAAGSNEELLGLTRGNALLANAMRQLGAEVTNADGSLKSMDEVFISLKRQIDNIASPGQRIEIVKAIFGEEAGGKLRALLNSTEGDIEKFFDGVRDAAGTTDKTRAAMDSFQLSTKRLGGNIENLTNQIGGMIGEALKPLINGLNAAIGASQQLPEPVKQIGAAAAAAGLATLGLVAAINALKVSLGVVGGIQAMTAALAAKAGAATGAAGAIKALTLVLALKAAAVGGLVIGLGVFVGALVNAATKNDRFRQSLRDGAVSASEGRKRLSELNAEVAALQVRLAQEPNGRLLNSLRGKIRRTAQEARLLRQEIEILEFWGEKGRAAGGSPNAGEYYQPGVGYFNLETGRFSRPDDRAVPPSMPSAGMPTAAGGGSGGGSGGSRSGGGGAATESLGAQIAKSLQQALNLTPAQSAGIVGNLIRESGLNPRVNEGGAVGSPRGVGGYGLAQWTGSRQTDLVRFAGGGDAAGNLQTQLRFMVHELLGPESRALASLRRTTTPEEAAVVFDRDYERSGIKALPERKANARRVYSEIAGTGPGVGLDGFASNLRAEMQAAEQLKQQQKEATDSLEKFVEARIQGIVKLNEESELLNATTDVQRRQLEYAFEQAAIKERARETEQEFLTLRERLNELGIEYNEEQLLGRIEAEKQQALTNARVKYEQEINDLMVERARMVQDIVRQSAGETAFNPLEQQKADLDALLEKYPAVGAAADAAATLATRGFTEMVTGARSAKEVFADFLRSIADALIDTAKTMIAQYIAIGIAKMSAGLGGGGGGGFFGSSAGPFGGSGISPGLSFDPSGFGRAMGGPVSAGRAHPVGERGPELFVPYQSGTIIPADVTEALAAANNAAQGPLLVPFQSGGSSAAMQRPAAGGSNGLSVPFQAGGASGANGLTVPFQAGGASGANGLTVPFQAGGASGTNGLTVPFLKGADGSDGAAGMVVIDNEPIRFESTVINSVEYVTRQEAEAIGKRSEQRTLKRLQNDPSTRRAAGIR